MFYYSETKYLYPLEKRKTGYERGNGALAGFVQISVRDKDGSVKFHFNGISPKEQKSGILNVYLLRDGKKVEPLAKWKLQDGEREKQKWEFMLPTAQQPLQEWEFGCFFDLGEAGYFGEDAAWMRNLFLLTEPAPAREPEIPRAVEPEPLREPEISRALELAPPRKPEPPRTVEPEWELEPPRVEEPAQEMEPPRAVEPHKPKLSRMAEPARKPEPREPQSPRMAEPDSHPETTQGKASTNTPTCQLWKSIYITDLSQLGNCNESWRRFRQNSFLLHGYYNHKHVIATEEVLGVPGTYFDREKRVADMFGFDGFVSVKELEALLLGETVYTDRQIRPGTFGYYIHVAQ